MEIEENITSKISTTVFIADDHPFVIDGYINAITRYKPEEFHFIIDRTKDCESAYHFITNPNTAPLDIAFLDISLPPYEEKNIYSGEDLAKLLLEYMPNCKIILLTMYTELLKIKTILKTINPRALIIKNDLNFEELLFAFDKVINNEIYLSQSVLKMLLQADQVTIEIDQFDQQILFHISKGTSLSDMTKYIPISIGAIERRKSDLKELLQITSGLDIDLVREAKNKGLLF